MGIGFINQLKLCSCEIGAQGVMHIGMSCAELKEPVSMFYGNVFTAFLLEKN